MRSYFKIIRNFSQTNDLVSTNNKMLSLNNDYKIFKKFLIF